MPGYNTAQKTVPGMIDYPIQREMQAYDNLPEDVRRVLREANFNVSAADMADNSLVMRTLGANGPDWLREQIKASFDRKFSLKAIFGVAP